MKIKIDLEHCYGIKKLNSEFNFDADNKIQLIYAGNGVMKSSFAKTFKSFSLGQTPVDNFFPQRASACSIKDEANNDIDRDSILVIDPPTQKKQSDKESLLLVNQALKDEYESIIRNFKDHKDEFEKEVKKNTKFKGELNQEIADALNIDITDEIAFYERLKTIVEEQTYYGFDKISYTDIFNSDVEKFLNTAGVKDQINEYVKKFEDLVTKSNYFKIEFNHINATQVSDSLKGNNFFKAANEIVLDKRGEKHIITTIEDLEKVIQEEKQTILEDPELQARFSKIDDSLEKNAGLRKFRTFINENKWIVGEFSNLESLKAKLWTDYLKRSLAKLESIVDVGVPTKKRVAEIVEQAKVEGTEWRNVVETFNRRFSLPYTLSVVNQHKVMLNSEAPTLQFTYVDGQETNIVTETVLEQNISTGEKKAWYLLNILFEIQARKHLDSECLLIVDDIADSFDYKNKYAIIEYLSEISLYPKFKLIILTHNFDFFRTVSRRFEIHRDNCFMPIKTSTEVRLCKAAYYEDPLKYWKARCSNNKKAFLSMIAMVRNLIGYSYGEGSDEFKKLTCLLHHKSDTEQITANQIIPIFNQVINPTINSFAEDFNVYEKIIQTADEIQGEEEETVNLENKIILSFAIRLKWRFSLSQILKMVSPRYLDQIKQGS